MISFWLWQAFPHLYVLTFLNLTIFLEYFSHFKRRCFCYHHTFLLFHFFFFFNNFLTHLLFPFLTFRPHICCHLNWKIPFILIKFLNLLRINFFFFFVLSLFLITLLSKLETYWVPNFSLLYYSLILLLIRALLWLQHSIHSLRLPLSFLFLFFNHIFFMHNLN